MNRNLIIPPNEAGSTALEEDGIDALEDQLLELLLAALK